jgi:hypothetical protein
MILSLHKGAFLLRLFADFGVIQKKHVIRKRSLQIFEYQAFVSFVCKAFKSVNLAVKTT